LAHVDLPRLNVAEVCIGTRALGPGLRAAVWVQGCPLRCPGCVSPDWIEQRTERLVDPAELAVELLADPRVDGLTLSGGEPMSQAAGLAAMVRTARATRPVTVVCFTGFTLDALRRHPPAPGVGELLAQVDVLIDGPYLARRDDGRGLRGSNNQRVHHLTDRLRGSGYDFAGRARTAEIRLRDRTAMLVGVPAPGLVAAFDRLTTAVAADRERVPR
jgi:anaerobic ribonucleoside-triphosphate reductase activating protein